MANNNHELDIGNGKMVIGPETKVFLYFGEGMDQYSHALVERPDLRDSLTNPELPNPTQHIFNKNMIRFLGGLAIPEDELDSSVILKMADSMREQVGQNVEIVIQERPDDYVIQKHSDFIKKQITRTSGAGKLYIPNEWIVEPSSREDSVVEPNLFSDEEIASRIKILRRGMKRFEILGKQVQLVPGSNQG